MIRKVISGGQVGADVAGLRAARRLGLETGGWMPAGFRTQDVSRPEYERMFGVRCTDTFDYLPRTRLNVQESDGTVRFAWDWTSRGELATLRELRRAGKPYYDVTIVREIDGATDFDCLPSELRYWLGTQGIRVLNVAGNASWWIEAIVEEFLVAALGPPVSSP